MGFKNSITSGRSVQFASDSVDRYRNAFAIDVFSSFIRYGDTLCKVNAHFLLDSHNYCMPLSTINFNNFFVPHVRAEQRSY